MMAVNQSAEFSHEPAAKDNNLAGVLFNHCPEVSAVKPTWR